MVRRNTVLLGLRDCLPNYTCQIQIRFGRYQLGQDSNRASLFPSVKLFGNHRRQSQQTRLELWLRLSRWFSGSNDLDCRCTSRRRKTLHGACDDQLTAFVELERQVLTVTFYLESIHAGDQ